MRVAKVSNKKFLTTGLLSIFLGLIGADRFYLGKNRSGFIKLITLGGLGVWYIIDLISILRGRAVDNQRLPVTLGREKWLKLSIILTIAVFIFSGIVGAVNYEEPKPVEPSGFSSLFTKEEKKPENPIEKSEPKQEEVIKPPAKTEEKKSLSQSDAKTYCQDAALLGQYLDLEKITIISLWNYDVQYTNDEATFTPSGYPISNLQWTGKNEAGKNVRFSCWVSGSKDNITLHWLSVDGITLSGSGDF